MRALIIMCIGVLIGRLIFPAVLKKSNEKLQIAVTALLIFTMGLPWAGTAAFCRIWLPWGVTACFSASSLPRFL